MDYQHKFYRKYRSTHTAYLYSKETTQDVKNQFPAFHAYFGRFLSENKDAKIFDAGCGNGEFLLWLCSLGFKNASGLDISEEQVNEAKALGTKDIQCGDILKFLPAHKDAFDMIFARDVLEHFPKEKVLDFMESVYAALKTGGVFIAQTVNAENLLWGRLRHGDFTHECAFTAQSIRQVLRVAGFREIFAYPQRPVVHGILSALRYIFWIIFEIVMKFYLLVETGNRNGIFTQNIIVVAKK